MTALFSQRYHRPLEQKALQVDIPEPVRRKLWSWLAANNPSLGIQRDPNDRWISNSSVLEETEIDLAIEHGWNGVTGAPDSSQTDPHPCLRDIFYSGAGQFVFDAIEMAGRMMDRDQCEALRQKVNLLCEMHECPWRLADGEFFKLDSDFMGARLVSTAHDALGANQFTGAADEFAKARQYLASEDIKETIYYASHSFESVMKVLTGLQHANADKLIKELSSAGYFDDLPESIRSGFAEQTLKTLPFLRNKLGGHGQGATIVQVPRVYGDLAVQLAAVFHNFLIAKHLERTPPASPPPEQKTSWLNDDIPF